MVVYWAWQLQEIICKVGHPAFVFLLSQKMRSVYLWVYLLGRRGWIDLELFLDECLLLEILGSEWLSLE